MPDPATTTPVQDETAALRRCVRDLVALSTLPAVWAQADGRTISESLVDVLGRMLFLDAVYVRVQASSVLVDRCATAAGRGHDAQCTRMRETLLPLLASGDATTPVSVIGAIDDSTPLRAVGVPLGLDGANGWIVALSARDDFPTSTERLLLGVAANAAAVVIERRNTEEHLREDKRIVDTLHRIGASFASELDRQRLIQMVTDEATALTGGEFGEFAPTFEGEGPVRSDDVTADPEYSNDAARQRMRAAHPTMRSYLAVPVLSRSGAVHGCLSFGHAMPGVFTERHERLASGIAAWAGLALDNADLYREVQEASRAKDDFLATVSHELRTPLNAVLGWATMLSQGIADGAQAQAAVAAIQRNAWSQVSLIEDLLDVSRFLTGTTRLELADVNVADSIAEAVDAVRLAADAKGVVLRPHPIGDPVHIRADGTRLRQILWNLLSNAIKFTPQGGFVDVVARRDGDSVVLSVKDTGEGIDPKFLPHVFDRFRQADPSTTREHSGLGLGLWIVRHLAELHGGTVQAESAGSGQGATFVVRLPVAGPS